MMFAALTRPGIYLVIGTVRWNDGVWGKRYSLYIWTSVADDQDKMIMTMLLIFQRCACPDIERQE